MSTPADKAHMVQLPQRPPAQSTYDCELLLPQLFLVCNSGPVGHSEGQWGRQWYSLSHQSAGIACQHVEFYGTPVQPNGKTALGLAQISEEFYGSNIAGFGLHLSEAQEYQARLQSLGLDCDRTFAQLKEGYYPIDLPQDLNSFIEDQLPEELDDLLDWKGQSELAKMVGILNRWQLAWVSNNSD